MFKHILIPVDGSDFSDRAIDAGVRFAKSVNAHITGFIAEPNYIQPSYSELMTRQAESVEAYENRTRQHAEAALNRLGSRARAEGVEFAASSVQSSVPYEAIVAAAEEKDCDLILMASHGRHGLDKLIHGSVAGEVMTHTRIPVLVVH